MTSVDGYVATYCKLSEVIVPSCSWAAIAHIQQPLSRCSEGMNKYEDRVPFVTAMIAIGLGSACSGELAGGVEEDSPVGKAESALTLETGAALWDPATPIPACFLSDSDNLPAHREWIRTDIHKSWEYATQLTVNWIDPCPATGWLVRIGLASRTSAQEETGWSAGYGAGLGLAGAQRDERAHATANLGSPDLERPSIKLYLRQDLAATDRERVGYLAIHEFGHVLAYAHEQDHPDSTCTNGQSSPQTEVTDYDPSSIMNYCTSNSGGYISHLDIVGAQALYGVGTRYKTTLQAVSSVVL